MTKLQTVTAFLFLLAAVAPGSAQEPLDARGLEMTRAQLEQILADYETAATSPGYSSSLRARAQREADLVRARLRDGDFQVGDRIVLRVRGEPQLSDTLTVEPGQTVTLREIGQIPLAGVLRSELQAHMTEQISRFVREPHVTTESLIRIAILGSVGRPGFFVLPASMLLDDALMAAGGPGGNAKLDDMEIRRGDTVVWEGRELQQAMIEGRTLDQLNLRAGDRIDVPQEKGGFFGGALRTALFVLPPLVALLTQVL